MISAVEDESPLVRLLAAFYQPLPLTIGAAILLVAFLLLIKTRLRSMVLLIPAAVWLLAAVDQLVVPDTMDIRIDALFLCLAIAVTTPTAVVLALAMRRPAKQASNPGPG
jgi:hypothetical protein